MCSISTSNRLPHLFSHWLTGGLSNVTLRTSRHASYAAQPVSLTSEHWICTNCFSALNISPINASMFSPFLEVLTYVPYCISQNCSPKNPCNSFRLFRWVEYGKRFRGCLCTDRDTAVTVNMDPFVQRFQPERFNDWKKGALNILCIPTVTIIFLTL